MEFRTFGHSEQNADLLLNAIPAKPPLDLHQANHYQPKCFVFTDIELTDLTKYPGGEHADGCRIGNGSISTYTNALSGKTKKQAENKSDRIGNGDAKGRRIKGKRLALAVGSVILCLLLGAGVPFALQLRSSSLLEARLAFIKRLLSEIPLIEGYWSPINLTNSLASVHEGMVGGVLWPVEIPCGAQHLDAVQRALEGMDMARIAVRARRNELIIVEDAREMERAHANGLVSVILGIQSGHALGSSLAVLRSLYLLGARFVSLTKQGCDTPWATAARRRDEEDSDASDSRDQDQEVEGITLFGQSIISEMNRLGMLLEVSGASELAMRQVLTVSRAPCLLANSVPAALCNFSTAIPDDVLTGLPQNGGIIMINVDHCGSQRLSMKEAIGYVNHVRNMAGVDHIGLSGATSTYPHLLAELARDRMWGNTAIKKLVGGNLVRALREVEAVRHRVPVNEEWVPEEAIEGHSYCRYPGV